MEIPSLSLREILKEEHRIYSESVKIVWKGIQDSPAPARVLRSSEKFLPTRISNVAEQLPYLKKASPKSSPKHNSPQTSGTLKTGKPPPRLFGGPHGPDLTSATLVSSASSSIFRFGHTAVSDWRFLRDDWRSHGVSETRPRSRASKLTPTQTYLEQFNKILDGKNEVRYKQRVARKMSAEEIVRLCSHTASPYLEREASFRCKNQPISVHELLYPLLTAMDPVKLQSMSTRAPSKSSICWCTANPARVRSARSAILTMPISRLDGYRKMSRARNYVAITEAPPKCSAKMMSIPTTDLVLHECSPTVPQKSPR